MTLDRFDITFVLGLIENKYGKGLWRHTPRITESVTVNRQDIDSVKIAFDVYAFQRELERGLKDANEREA